MGRIRNTLALAAVGAALSAPTAHAAAAPAAADTATPLPAVPAGTPEQPASTTTEPAKPLPDLGHGDTISAPPEPAPQPKQPGGGTSAGQGSEPHQAKPAPEPEPEGSGGTVPAPINPPSLTIPSLPSSTCASSGVPPILIPIYQRAAEAYGLGPQGPAILAGINEIETGFGTNLNVSSAGAIGWMQFMPSTWETYGVDANGDGVSDPYNPEDAIFAAARYLAAAGMPADTYGAIYAYNHADWYVQEVLANASCYSPVAGTVAPAVSLEPKLQQLSCRTAPTWAKEVPAQYLSAFEEAAARYELGKRGVWVLAGVARLESNFGRNMTRRQLAVVGPLGLERGEWARYAVDGNEDGRIQHSSPADSAATLARLLWSRGSLRAGVFTHNQAAWYVEAVMTEADRLEGVCRIKTVQWSLALPKAASSYVNPFALSTNLVTGRVDQGVDFTGTGSIVAIGNAIVLGTGAPGWPEGGGVLYQLLDGPLKGEVIFVYEGVDATVQPGQRVKAGEQIAAFRPGGSIEIGFSDTAGVPLSHAEYYEGKVTESGLEMFSLLQALGI
jgi:murein DD-endopeptidase MepM/ murein hydrolase activator NlpD